MALRRLRARPRGEPLIALINVVFLMLIFFLVAAAVAPPLERGVSLVRTDEIEGRAPPDAAVIRPDGTLVYRGEEIGAEGYLAARSGEGDGPPALRLVPDQELPASRLVEIAGELREGGAGDIWIVTERGLP